MKVGVNMAVGPLSHLLLEHLLHMKQIDIVLAMAQQEETGLQDGRRLNKYLRISQVEV